MSGTTRQFKRLLPGGCLFLALLVIPACHKDQKAEGPHGPVEVTVVTVKPQNIPVVFEFVGQTQSSHQVEIRARVEGFLENKKYEEGTLIKAGQLMFQMDRRPFEASMQEASGELAQQQARWDAARANLARIKPLAEKNAVSKKDLDDAVGNEKSAAASVISAQGKLRQAELNLSYTTITSPIGGASSQAKKQGGSYISMSDSLLTHVARLDPIWVNFSVSENERLKIIDESRKGTIKIPDGENYDVEIVLADGTVFPKRGRLSFADPSFSQETGTFLVRAVLANPSPYLLRPGQFVRVKLSGAIRQNAIAVPRRAVVQGAKGHFVWVVDKENTAEFRNIIIGDWYGDSCFIMNGLKDDERVVVDGGIKLAPGVPVKIVEPQATDNSAGGQKPETAPSQKAPGPNKK